MFFTGGDWIEQEGSSFSLSHANYICTSRNSLQGQERASFLHTLLSTTRAEDDNQLLAFVEHFVFPKQLHISSI